MTTVTWTQDANSNYEISSPEHLKQLMNKGTLYTDAGTFPTDYWAAGTNYIQTADIDLLGDSTDIKPIGIETDIFYGIYDGGEFSISNWSYIDPEFETANNNESYIGLFGYCRDTFTLKNIRLNGVWTLQGYRSYTGFLLGYGHDNGNTEIRGVFNIECDFSKGTFIENTPNKSGTAIGCIFGRLLCPIIEGVTLRGEIDLRNGSPGTFNSYVGGISGELIVLTKGSFIQNLATFPNGLSASGRTVGGITGGYYSYNDAPLSHCLNAMIGDITGSFRAGGMIGYAVTGSEIIAEYLVNSMYGDIVYSGTDTTITRCAGGVFGHLRMNSVATINKLLNYMTGDIISISPGGGLVGSVNDYSDTEFNDSLNAMNGDVKSPIIGRQQNSNLVVSRVQFNTNYGLTFDEADTYSTSTAPSGFLTNSILVDLPYFDIDGTDEIGNTYNFDFVYANLGGNVSYSTTHLVVVQGQSLFQDGAVLIPDPLTVEPRAVNIRTVIAEVPGSIGYKISYLDPDDIETTFVQNVTTLEHNITGLVSDTDYVIRLYVDTGTGYVLTEEVPTRTLTNISSNYDVIDFIQEGVVKLNTLPKQTLREVNKVMNELFNTGEKISVSIKGKSDLRASFIKRGESLNINGLKGVMLPFEEGNTRAGSEYCSFRWCHYRRH